MAPTVLFDVSGILAETERLKVLPNALSSSELHPDIPEEKPLRKPGLPECRWIVETPNTPPDVVRRRIEEAGGRKERL